MADSLAREAWRWDCDVVNWSDFGGGGGGQYQLSWFVTALGGGGETGRVGGGDCHAGCHFCGIENRKKPSRTEIRSNGSSEWREKED